MYTNKAIYKRTKSEPFSQQYLQHINSKHLCHKKPFIQGYIYNKFKMDGNFNIYILTHFRQSTNIQHNYNFQNFVLVRSNYFWLVILIILLLFIKSLTFIFTTSLKI